MKRPRLEKSSVSPTAPSQIPPGKIIGTACIHDSDGYNNIIIIAILALGTA